MGPLKQIMEGAAGSVETIGNSWASWATPQRSGQGGGATTTPAERRPWWSMSFYDIGVRSPTSGPRSSGRSPLVPPFPAQWPDVVTSRVTDHLGYIRRKSAEWLASGHDSFSNWMTGANQVREISPVRPVGEPPSMPLPPPPQVHQKAIQRQSNLPTHSNPTTLSTVREALKPLWRHWEIWPPRESQIVSSASAPDPVGSHEAFATEEPVRRQCKIWDECRTKHLSSSSMTALPHVGDADIAEGDSWLALSDDERQTRISRAL
jgi:hypothetical protein